MEASRRTALTFVERAFALVATLVPMAVAMAHTPAFPDAAHDEGVLRVLGGGFTGTWRTLDMLCALPLRWLPLGAWPWRAAAVSWLAVGFVGFAVFRLAFRLLQACAPGTKFPPAFALVAATSASLGPAMQSEAVAVGGSGLGVALALAPLWLVAEAGFGEWRWFAAGVLSALAMGHEPLVGLVALGGVVPAVAVTLVQERRRWTELVTLVAAGLPLGFIPLGLGLWRSVLPLEYKLSVSLFHQWAGEWASSPPVAGWSEALAWQGDQLGMVALVLALLGALLGAVMVPSREVAAGLFGVWASALVAQAFGVALGPTRFGATALAATCALAIFATGGMQFLSRLLARMKVPMAEMSAGLVVMMFLVLPLKILDDTLMHFAGRRGDASAVWGTQVFGAMPERAVLLVSDPALHRRCLVARATGFLREDVLVIPLFDLASAEVIRATAQEPKLIPLIRDLMLGNAPEEWSLATVLEARPLVMTFEPSWPSALARHFMALGPFERFEPEPHGHTDRRRALDAWSDGARRLFDVSSPLEPELRALTGHLAQRRWLAFASNRDKDLLETVQSQFQGILQERGVEFSSKELDVPGTLIPTVTIPGEKGPWNPKTCASCFRKTAFAK